MRVRVVLDQAADEHPRRRRDDRPVRDQPRREVAIRVRLGSLAQADARIGAAEVNPPDVAHFGVELVADRDVQLLSSRRISVATSRSGWLSKQRAAMYRFVLSKNTHRLVASVAG